MNAVRYSRASDDGSLSRFKATYGLNMGIIDVMFSTYPLHPRAEAFADPTISY